MSKDLINPNKPEEIPTFDITSLNLIELGRRLKETMHTYRPSTIFFKKRHNEKAILDIEYQRALISQIEDLSDMNSALLNLNADVYLTQERLERIIQRYREQENFVDAEGYRLAEKAEKQHADDMVALEDNAKLRKKNIEALELQNKKLEAEIAILKAKENNIIGEGLRDSLKRDFMQKVIDTIDLKELPDYLRTFVINSIFNPEQKIDNSLAMMDELKEFVIRKEEASARKEEAEAKERESQADIDRATADFSVYELNRNKIK